MEINFITKDELEQLTKKVDELIQIISQEKGNQSKYYSNDELCKVLKVSKRTLQNYRDKGWIEFIQVGRKIFYPMKCVDAFMEAKKVTTY